jgi:hypothetical protein
MNIYIIFMGDIIVDEEPEINILFYSSMIFVTNIYSTIYNQYYIYSFLFLLLTISSLIYHYPTKNIYANIFDKICITMVIIYGGVMLYDKTSLDNISYTLVVVLLFLFVNYLYCFGYCTEQYCFHQNKYIGDVSHAIIHITSSIGHHFITFLR